MGKIFDMEGPLFTGLSRLADLIWLNILFLICSIPIVTIGASFTAMYYVTMKMVKNEESYITKSFFRSFKLNFKQSTIIWLILLAVYGILFIDVRIMNGYYGAIVEAGGNFNKIILALLFAIFIILTFITIYIFPVLAKFYNSIKNTFKNALLISARHFPYTILLIVLNIAPFVLMYLFYQLMVLFVFLVFSGIAYVSSYIFVKLFDLYLPHEEADPDEFHVEALTEEN